MSRTRPTVCFSAAAGEAEPASGVVVEDGAQAVAIITRVVREAKIEAVFLRIAAPNTEYKWNDLPRITAQ